jgi:hypothetical protein
VASSGNPILDNPYNPDGTLSSGMQRAMEIARQKLGPQFTPDLGWKKNYPSWGRVI